MGPARWRAKLFTGTSAVTMGAGRDGEDDTQARIKWFSGGTLTMDSGGLTVKATLAQARTEPNGAAQRDVGRQLLGAVAALPLPGVSAQAAELLASYAPGLYITRYAALGAAWDHGPWQLQAELARTTGNFVASRGWFGYGSAAWRTGSLTFFGMAGVARDTDAPSPETNWVPVLTPIVGPTLATGAQRVATGVADGYNLGRIDQHSVSAGLRWDMTSQTALKIQLDDIHTAPYGAGLWTNGTTDAHHALVFSTGVDFVF
jgi:hypothetical protein